MAEKKQDLTVVVRYLVLVLGQKATAYLSGCDDVGKVSRWLKGEEIPDTEMEMRLDCAFQVAYLIAPDYGVVTAKAWMFGTNTTLGEQSPAKWLRDKKELDDLTKVVAAAKKFVGG